MVLSLDLLILGLPSKKQPNMKAQIYNIKAEKVGEELAKLAVAKKIKKVTFDRNGD